MKLAFKIAVRFLKSGKGQTILIALGIAIGVSVQIFIGLLIQGLQSSLVDKTIGNSSQITVLSKTEDKAITGYTQLIDKILKSDSRIDKISAAYDSPVFIKSSDKTTSVLLRGFIFNDADKIYNIKNRIVKGKLPEADNEILIGKEISNELSLNTGDKVELITAKGTKAEVVITGIYDLKVASINKSWIMSNIQTAQSIFDEGDSATSIEIQVTDVFKADQIAEVVSSKLSDGNLKVENWKAQNEELLSGLNGQSISSIMIQVFVLIAVILGIASVLAISVLQKSKQLGILKAMGIKDRTASLIFLFQGLILGVLGALFGIGFGLILAVSFTKFALNPDGTPVVALYINYGFIVLSGLISVISAMAASLIPARRSSRLNPIEVIKNG